MKMVVALLALVFLAGCIRGQFTKMSINVGEADLKPGKFEMTTQTFLVKNPDATYYVKSAAMSKDEFDAVLHGALNISIGQINGQRLYFLYEGKQKDENIMMLMAYRNGVFYEIGTDTQKRDKQVMEDLFDFYFKKH